AARGSALGEGFRRQGSGKSFHGFREMHREGWLAPAPEPSAAAAVSARGLRPSPRSALQAAENPLESGASDKKQLLYFALRAPQGRLLLYETDNQIAQT